MVRVVSLNSDEVRLIVCYPMPVNECFKTRIDKLISLGVKDLVLNGSERDPIHKKVLGVGHAGIVVQAIWNNKLVALKIRRIDSKRGSLEVEAMMQMLAHNVNVAPRVYAYDKDFIVMDYVDGIKLSEWLRIVDDKEEITFVIKNILDKCRKLDIIGLDHGELSRAHSHIVISKTGEVYILDYESASTNRKPKNVTSICSYLFLGGSKYSKNLRRILNINVEVLKRLLREYKSMYSEHAYHNILEYLLH